MPVKGRGATPRFPYRTIGRSGARPVATAFSPAESDS